MVRLFHGQRLDLALGSFEFSEAATIEYGSAPRWASIARTSPFGVEFYVEVFGSWNCGSSPVLSSFESTFWQGQVRRYRSTPSIGTSDRADMRTTIGSWLLASLKVGGLLYGVQWMHAFTDNSGQILPAVTLYPYMHLTVTFGFPCSYGADGYARMTGKPSSTLLHFGAGFTNGSLNLSRRNSQLETSDPFSDGCFPPADRRSTAPQELPLPYYSKRRPPSSLSFPWG
jgi:hypothetical protein